MRFLVAITLLAPSVAHAQSFLCEDHYRLDATLMAEYHIAPEPAPPPAPAVVPDPLKDRLLKYATLAVRHRLGGLASYYSTSLEGTLTANGERYRHRRLTAAHLTLPLGTWLELRSRATGKSVRVRVNDRGPYTKKFAIDLSQSAARALGVDVTDDRWVYVRILALPGEEPLR
jgi:rare lipoprotein A